jgi:large subunit ribosomal protein L13
MTSTKSINKDGVTRKWWVVDASTMTLGRLSVVIANQLIGKGKPNYTPHVDGGDFVIVINSDKLVVTGAKLDDKPYYRHSGYPGNLKTMALKDMITKDSRKVIELAVKGMLPKNKLVDGRLKRLKIYKDDQHNNSAQQPTKLEVKK